MVIHFPARNKVLLSRQQDTCPNLELYERRTENGAEMWRKPIAQEAIGLDKTLSFDFPIAEASFLRRSGEAAIHHLVPGIQGFWQNSSC